MVEVHYSFVRFRIPVKYNIRKVFEIKTETEYVDYDVKKYVTSRFSNWFLIFEVFWTRVQSKQKEGNRSKIGRNRFAGVWGGWRTLIADILAFLLGRVVMTSSRHWAVSSRDVIKVITPYTTCTMHTSTSCVQCARDTRFYYCSTYRCSNMDGLYHIYWITRCAVQH